MVIFLGGVLDVFIDLRIDFISLDPLRSRSKSIEWTDVIKLFFYSLEF